MMNKKIIILAFAITFVACFGIIFNVENVSAQEATVCCERTNSGAFCQDVPAEECAPGSTQAQTACESTNFCKPGTCYDSDEGTCLDNTPQVVCNENGGLWNEERPAQCNLGCCILGDQGAFVSLVRCKKLSASFGLETNYDSGITNEVQCIEAVQAQDKGACVFEFEFERTCKFTTRAECDSTTQSINGTVTEGDFFKDVLCSAEELGTNCGPSRQTTCLPGKDEVYFLDTCGNPANIYDASKVNDKDYWTNVRDKAESCNPESGNAGSASCGNCNYLAGSFCRSESNVGASATHGDFICADLNCVDSEGNDRLHGESWCSNDDSTTGVGKNSVGSEFFREICINGEVKVETCAEFRNEECVEGAIEIPGGTFSQAVCTVNRWQDCLAQIERAECEDADARDCSWKPGITLANEEAGGVCVPKNSPGLNFWNSEETRAICNEANKVCVVKFEKSLLGGGDKCVENCECLEDSWVEQHSLVCSALGDCGSNVNFIGQEGFGDGFEVIK